MASQYSTILTSDSSTTVNQYDVIKYSDYENLRSKYSEYKTVYQQTYLLLNSSINLRVEGGGSYFSIGNTVLQEPQPREVRVVL